MPSTHGKFARYASGHWSFATVKYFAGLQLSCSVCPYCCNCLASHGAGGDGAPPVVRRASHSPFLTISTVHELCKTPHARRFRPAGMLDAAHVCMKRKHHVVSCKYMRLMCACCGGACFVRLPRRTSAFRLNHAETGCTPIEIACACSGSEISTPTPAYTHVGVHRSSEASSRHAPILRPSCATHLYRCEYCTAQRAASVRKSSDPPSPQTLERLQRYSSAVVPEAAISRNASTLSVLPAAWYTPVAHSHRHLSISFGLRPADRRSESRSWSGRSPHVYVPTGIPNEVHGLSSLHSSHSPTSSGFLHAAHLAGSTRVHACPSFGKYGIDPHGVRSTLERPFP